MTADGDVRGCGVMLSSAAIGGNEACLLRAQLETRVFGIELVERDDFVLRRVID